MLFSSALFLGSHQQSFLIYLLQPWCLLPGLLFNYFPVICIWKHCSFFPLYYSARDLFSCYPAGSRFFTDGYLLKWESFLQLNALSLRNHSRFMCKRILKLIQAIQGNWCFLLGEVVFFKLVVLYQGHCVLKRLFINNEHTEVLAIGWSEKGEREQAHSSSWGWVSPSTSAPKHRHSWWICAFQGGCSWAWGVWTRAGDALPTLKGRVQF